jgi:uncharacterized protein YcbK (DUF882 family)
MTRKLLHVLTLLVAPAMALIFLQPFIQTCQVKQPVQASELTFAPPPPDILTHEGIDSVLQQFETIRYKQLDTAYINYSDPLAKFRKKLKNVTYYVITGRAVFQKIVGPYRILQFLTRDKYYAKNMNELDKGHTQYWALNRDMLHMLLDLILTLKEKGYNEYGFGVRNGHRHPLYNMRSKGSGDSQHQYGTAVDLEIRDINKDGKVSKEDKDIVLEILEEIVGNEGGVGLYPGTMSVHFDCRGYRARWNSYKSPY